MTYRRCICHPDDLPGVGISSGWVTANSLYHPDDILFHFMSSGWLNWGWFLIRMSYGNVIMSSGWDTLPFLSHPDEIANFDFPQHAVALQRFRTWPLHADDTFKRVLLYETWWRHQMATFSALLAICARNSPVPGEIPTQRPVTRSFDVFCDLRLNKRLSKQSWSWWFETLLCPLWRHCNGLGSFVVETNDDKDYRCNIMAQGDKSSRYYEINNK